LLDHIGRVEPALQVAAAKLSFFVFLVAGALPSLLDFHFVMGKLRRSVRARSGDFASRQRFILVCAARPPPDSALRTSLYSKAKAEPKPADVVSLGLISG